MLFEFQAATKSTVIFFTLLAMSCLDNINFEQQADCFDVDTMDQVKVTIQSYGEKTVKSFGENDENDQTTHGVADKDGTPEHDLRKSVEKLPNMLAVNSRASTHSGSKTSLRLSVSSASSHNSEHLDLDWNCDKPIELAVNGFGWKLFGFAILNSLLAIWCVAIPFGPAFRKDGDNSIAANWAYYFVYSVFGWSYPFFKVILVQAFVWDTDFFCPFMKFETGIFEVNKSFAVFVISIVFATVLYLVGYGIFKDPVPLGTISFGAPCCVVCFALMYFLMIPPESRKTLRDHILIVKVLIPFIFWLVGLCCYIVLTWLLYYPVNDIENYIGRTCAQVSISVSFNVIRTFLSGLPLRLTIGSVNDNLSALWRVSYRAQVSIFTMFMFPSMPNGWLAPALIVVAGLLTNLLELLRAPKTIDACPTLIGLFTGLSCDILSSISFLGIFAYNAFGPNKQHMYIIDELSDEEAMTGIYKIVLAIGAAVVKFAVILGVTYFRFEPSVLTRLKNFGKLSFSVYYWVIFWMLESTLLMCGACIIMKHDGMDLSLRFRSWSWW
jgi:hypothetical protein